MNGICSHKQRVMTCKKIYVCDLFTRKNAVFRQYNFDWGNCFTKRKSKAKSLRVYEPPAHTRKCETTHRTISQVHVYPYRNRDNQELRVRTD